jgi:hypothetical protein
MKPHSQQARRLAIARALHLVTRLQRPYATPPRLSCDIAIQYVLKYL